MLCQSNWCAPRIAVTGGQFYDLYPASLGSGRLVVHPVYADERQRRISGRAPGGHSHKEHPDEGMAPPDGGTALQVKTRARQIGAQFGGHGAYPKKPTPNTVYGLSKEQFM